MIPSPDAMLIATSSDNKIILWNSENSEQIGLPINFMPKYMCFSPDGKILVSSNQNSLLVLDSKTG